MTALTFRTKKNSQKLLLIIKKKIYTSTLGNINHWVQINIINYS